MALASGADRPSQTVRPTLMDKWRFRAIAKAVPGYSDLSHYSVFRYVLETYRIERLLVLGVYFGRDISFFLDIARRLKQPLSVTGVDKFSDDACEDWPVEQKALNWEQAGFGKAPSIEAARANVAQFGQANLVKARDDAFLDQCQDKFDAVYIDTSHDYETVMRQIRQSARLVQPSGILFGDDYSDEGTWGVKKAVSELAPDHVVIGDWIWLTPLSTTRLV